MLIKYILCTLPFLVLSANTNCLAQFRNIKWGATKQQVIDAEGKPDQNNDNRLFYKNKKVGLYINVITEFNFNPKKQLVHGQYTFIDPEHEIIKEIGRALDRKYGATKLSTFSDGSKVFQWSPRGSHITIRYDDVGFLLSYYEENYWKELVKNDIKRRSEGL